jgi:hypothetical protein
VVEPRRKKEKGEEEAESAIGEKSEAERLWFSL